MDELQRRVSKRGHCLSGVQSCGQQGMVLNEGLCDCGICRDDWGQQAENVRRKGLRFGLQSGGEQITKQTKGFRSPEGMS